MTPQEMEITEKLKQVRLAAVQLRTSSPERRSETLRIAAKLLKEREKDVLGANNQDVFALTAGTPAFKDRLLLNPQRLASAAESLKQVADLPNPLGEEVDRRRLENGLLVRRVRSPLGVILMIFESRPNVALEAFSLALKSGNLILLRGGKESMKTTKVIYDLLGDALEVAGLSRDFFWGITDPDRKIVEILLTQKTFIDVVVPRGGDSLIDFVMKTSQIPIIKNDRGLCHVYVHEDADLGMAADIVVNAKTQRPGVCNAMETLLVHSKVKDALLPKLFERMQPLAVQWFGDEATLQTLKGKIGVKPVHVSSYDTEYLDYKMSCRVVDSLDDAIRHIEEHGSRHSESIVTASEAVARKFQAKVDAAAVYWNASTRFTDGFELGLGGELGISTQKLHVRGPVGLRELTSVRWIIDGTGQTRK